jgi:hypothetical protein
MGFANNPYNVYARSMTTYLLKSNSKKVLENISDNLICKYEAAPSQVSIQHNFLGIDRDLSVLGDVTRSMKGFVNNIITKYKVHSNIFHRCCILPPSTMGQEKSLSLMRHDGKLSGKTFSRSPPSHFAHLNAYVRPRKTSRSSIESCPSFSIRKISTWCCKLEKRFSYGHMWTHHLGYMEMPSQ